MTPEGRIKSKVTAAIKLFGRRIWKFMPVQTGYGLPALDYLLCVNGKFVAIETKAKGHKLTPRQDDTKVAIEAAGGLVFVVDDDESRDVTMARIALLEKFGVPNRGPRPDAHYCFDCN
jgi:hypothetical protein